LQSRWGGRLLLCPPSGAERLALSGVDQACGIQQRDCLIEQLLDVESDFQTFLVKARAARRSYLRLARFFRKYYRRDHRRRYDVDRRGCRVARD